MANCLLANRGDDSDRNIIVGANWAFNFIKRTNRSGNKIEMIPHPIAASEWISLPKIPHSWSNVPNKYSPRKGPQKPKPMTDKNR